MTKVLIVDDEASIRKTLTEILEFQKYEVESASDGLEALAKIKKNKYDVVILDIKMPKMNGIETLERIQDINPDIPVIMISGHGNIDTAVEAVKKGAFDFVSKPPDLNRILITIKNALDKSSLITETKTLKKKSKNTKVDDLIGESAEIEEIKETIQRIAPTDARVLITGENGTGKEVVAKWIHAYSSRSDKPWVEVNCAAIPSELIESELFGHEKGSFTSAVKQRIGKFELANEGTIFLDEIGDMSLSAQAKVLRALQENRISRVGGDKDIKVDVRVIAATNKNLEQEIKKGNFREDLYFRLAVILLNVPRLEERKEDIPLLIEHFSKKICKEQGVSVKRFEKKAVKILQEMPWSGNVRELRNVVERLIILSDKKVTASNVNDYVSPKLMSKSRFADLFHEFDDIKAVHRYIEKEYSEYKESSDA